MSRKLFRALTRPAVGVTALSLTALAMTSAPAEAKPYDAFLLTSVASGYCADLPGYGPGTPDGPVNLWHCSPVADNQLFQRNLTQTQPAAYYQIQNMTDGLCLDLPERGWVAEGTPVTEYPCAANPSQDNQEWRFVTDQYGINQLVNVASGFCLWTSGRLDSQLRVMSCMTGPYTQWDLN